MPTNKNNLKKLPQRFLQQSIIKLLKSKPDKSYDLRSLTSSLGVKNSKDSIESALNALMSKKQVSYESSSGRYSIQGEGGQQIVNRRRSFLEGQIDIIASGAGFVAVKDESQDYYISEKHLNGAMHKDVVLIAPMHSTGRRPEAKVVDIVKRHRNSFIGRLQKHKNYSLVHISDDKIDIEVKIMPDDLNGAQEGDVVIIEIYEFGKKSQHQMLGKVTSIIDLKDSNDYEMSSILINNGFNIVFPAEVVEEANKLSDKITAQDLNERRDLRDKNIFTIDPLDARDFDDAVSIEVLENGHTEIGVHIADVTHFVKEGTLLDKEAFARSTSVYLVDRVCPMLPEKISNELCSLRPFEDKFSFSAIFEFDLDLQLKKEWFGKTLIHSKRRFTYEEAQEVIESGEGDFAQEIQKLNNIAQKLKARRFKEGSIDFETDEVRFVLDENNKPIGIKKKERKESHKLVEEFMLLANRKVAQFISLKSKSPVPFVYRVHDLPDPERLMELALLASEFGIKLNVDTPRNIADSLNRLSSEETDQDLVAVLKPLAIRCMAKAIYSTDNIGHYGLGFDYYTHFTSPIRRYSDVLVHRLLYQNLSKEYRVKLEVLEEQCVHISSKERSAVNAERESIKYKQIEYLEDHVGEEYEGLIRNMIDKGIFVELTESQADGMIRFDTMDERYTLHPAKIKATGNSSGLVLRIGDRIRVKLTEVNSERRQIELAFLSKIN
jgi:ribonuclease R